MRLPTFGRGSTKVEPDIPMAPQQQRESGSEWDQVRNPAIGVWQVTLQRRIVWGVMAAALPIAIVSLGVSWLARGSAAQASNDVEQVAAESRSASEWRPRHKIKAHEAAAAFAATHGYDESVVQIDDLDQLWRYGGDFDMFVGSYPADPYSSRELGQDGTLERYVFLLSGQGYQEVMSFFVDDIGDVSLPTFLPVDESESSAALMEPGHEAVAEELGEEKGSDVDMDAIAWMLSDGIASSGWVPPGCGSVDSESDSDMIDRVEEFTVAYTARDSEALALVAGSGAEWPVYPRIGWQAVPGSATVVCGGVIEGEGVIQVLWLVESVGDTVSYRTEVRDVNVRDVEGLWSVYGAGPMLSGGFVPEIETDG